MPGMTFSPVMLQAGGIAPAAGGATAAGGTAAGGVSAANLLFASVLGDNIGVSLAPLPQEQQDQLAGLFALIQPPQEIVAPLPEIAASPATGASEAALLADAADITALASNTIEPEVAPVADSTTAEEAVKAAATPQGLFGSRDNTSEQSIQNLVARVATTYTQATDEQAQAALNQKHAAAATTQDKVVTLLQAGSALPTLQPAAADNSNKDNPLLAIAKKVSNTSTVSLPETQTVVKADTSTKTSDQPLSSNTKDTLAGLTNPTTQPHNAAADQNNAANVQNAPAPAHQPILSTPGAGQELVSGQSTTVDQVHVKIAQAVKNGESRIELNLEPAHLGKIQVHIDLSGGKVNISVMAEKSETLDLLKNEAGSLQKSLAEAGIKADSGSLQFAQRDPNANGFTNQFGGRNYTYTQNSTGAPANDEAIVTNPAYRMYESNRALDIFA